jgi:thymidylate synthase (FAD)
MPTAELVYFTPDYMKILQMAAGNCYEKNVGPKGIEHIIQSGHLSVLEHCDAVFNVTCSVRVLGQITRHRHLHFTVKSSRGSTFDTDDIIIPEGLSDYWIERYLHITEYLLNNYQKGIDDGMALQDMAYLLPQGIQTKMTVSGNFRAWFEYLPKRLCARAMPEHRDLAKKICFELSTHIPEVFYRNMMPCENCNEESCEFHG